MHEESHRYQYNGTYLDGSVSAVVNPMTKEEKDWIYQKYPEAAPRGTAIHACMEEFLKTGRQTRTGSHGEPHPFLDWLDGLYSHHIWDTHSPIASEYMVVDPDSSLAGCVDAILINEDDTSPLYKSLLLLDLKTKSQPNSRPPNATKQLGGYINLLRTSSPDHADFADQIKQCAILVNRPAPGPTTLHFYDVNIAEESFKLARDQYHKRKRRYSF